LRERERSSSSGEDGVQLRRDHVAGGAILVAGALVLAASTDLPFGTLASPGAGMLPTVVVVLLMAFASILLLAAGGSPPLGSIDWSDAPHAARVVGATAGAVALYVPLGFIASIALLLFVLTFLVEQKPLVRALAFSGGATLLAYLTFASALHAALPRGWWH
jgi:Tripartite tricarboxylate transporter TctB family